jgi:hypothetical protein
MLMATGPTALTYNSYVSNMALLAVVADPTDANFVALVPQMLNYAELRIQRDLDLLPMQTASTYQMQSGDFQIQVPVADFVTIQSVVIQKQGKYYPLTQVTKEFLQNVFPDPAFQGNPQYIAPAASEGADTNAQLMDYFVAPAVDAVATAAVSGTAHANSLAQWAGTPQAGTLHTFISAQLPDLLLMASMVYISGYQRNFSASGDDPQMAVNYEKQYQTLLKGAMGEELRKRWRASAWSAEAPSPAASPNRM